MRENEERLRAIVLNAPIGIATSGPDHYFISANQAFCSILGYTEEELKEMTFSDITYPEDLEKSKDLVEDLSEGKISTFILKKRYVKKDGSVITGKLSNSCVRDSDGIIRLFIAQLEDITEQTLAENALKKSEARYRGLMEHSPNYILLVDKDGTIVDCNDKIASLLNLEPATIIGSNALDVAKQRNLDEASIKRLGDIGPMGNFNDPVIFSIKLTEGQIMWLKAFINPLEIENEHFYQVVMDDITAQHEAAQLITEELEKLKELDRIRTEFINRASHELKTPLNSILSASDLLLNLETDQLSQNVTQLLTIINKGGHRLNALVEDILDLIRMNSKKFKITQTWTYLLSMVTECLEDLQFQINQRNLDISVKISDDLLLFVDRLRFSQLISNLVINAINNTPPKGKIVIAANINAENNIAEFSVKDTGVGITPEEKEQLFKIFGKIERYGKGIDVISEGTGLGLYISKQIVNFHGGEIWVESAGRNKGAKFVVQIPTHLTTDENVSKVYYDSDKNIIVVNYARFEPLESLKQLMERIIKISSETGEKRILLDTRALETFDTIIRVFGRTELASLILLGKSFRMAFLYNDKIPETIVRFIETSLRNRGVETNIFQDEESALNWLG